jgi:hypothetical protein
MKTRTVLLKGVFPMTNRNRILFRLLYVLFVALLGAGAAACAGTVARESKASAQVDNFTRRFEAELSKQDFEVNKGYFLLWDIEGCVDSFPILGGCAFNNPTAPYVFPVVPYWSDEFVDPGTAGAFGETDPGYGTTFRLDPNEAIVIFGFLPPEAAYFGIQSYLFTRKGEYQTDNETYEFHSFIGTKDFFFHKMPLNPERIGSWDSLSNSTNNVAIERQSGSIWNQFRYFIITPDRQMDMEVRQVLRKLSVATKDIFTEGIPSNMQIGLDKDADDFLTLFRYSLPADGGEPGTASDTWRHDPSLVVLRIRATGSDRPSERYPAWEEDSPEKRTAVPEAYLQNDLNRLVYKVSETWGQPCESDDCSGQAMSFLDTMSEPFNMLGPKCDNVGMDCLGDTQDASYNFIGAFGFDNNEVYAVIGTLGTATGNATYVSLALNNTHLKLGAKNVTDAQLAGSATPQFYPGVNNLDKLYVYYFARDCEGLENLTHGFCISVEDTELVIPRGVTASFAEREYVKVGTQRGPDSTLTLPSVVLILHRPTQ